MNKRCTECGVFKSTDQFHVESSTKDGLHHNCKSCRLYKLKRFNRQKHERLDGVTFTKPTPNPDLLNDDKRVDDRLRRIRNKKFFAVFGLAKVELPKGNL